MTKEKLLAETEADMLRGYRRIVTLVGQEKPPKRDDVDKACKAYNEAVHRFLKTKHTK